ncbi:MAG: zinc-ribbon domain-containing protein [Clostridia bacterium]|nr:zinc-ribbon domain-containing protein [Clostridia bacterium]
MYCKYCGQKIEDGFRFCMNCGKPVDMPAQTPEKIGPVIPVAPVVPVPVPERVKEAPAEAARKEDAALEYLDKSAPQEAPKADGGADAYLEKQAKEAAETLSSTVTYEMSEETGKVITAVGEKEKEQPAAPQIQEPAPAPVQPEYTVFAGPAAEPAPQRPAVPPQSEYTVFADPAAPAPQPVAPPRPAPAPQPVYPPQPAPQQPYALQYAPQRQPYAPQYAPQQQPYAQQYAPQQQQYAPQQYVQQQYAPVPPVAPPVIVTPPPVKAEPEKPGNGQAVAGIVFGVISLILLSISAILLSNLTDISNYSSMSGEALAASALGGGVLLGLGSVTYLFNFIFGLIGFIKGLKHRSRVAAGVVAMVLLIINLILIIACIGMLVHTANLAMYM